jgi:hypothetical protein
MRKTPGSRYDALTLGMREDLAGPFAPLFELPWLELLAERVGLAGNVTTAVDGGLHHVPRGSASGWVHTDCCSGWFNGAATEGKLLFPDRRRCDYFTGMAKEPDAEPVEYVRAATMIFYLHNDGWANGMGGETGLYPGSKAAYGGQALVPPLNNSLLLFACSPHSYHRLVKNPGIARNSIILWLHSTVDIAEARWGKGIHRRSPQ